MGKLCQPHGAKCKLGQPWLAWWWWWCARWENRALCGHWSERSAQGSARFSLFEGGSGKHCEPMGAEERIFVAPANMVYLSPLRIFIAPANVVYLSPRGRLSSTPPRGQPVSACCMHG